MTSQLNWRVAFVLLAASALPSRAQPMVEVPECMTEEAQLNLMTTYLHTMIVDGEEVVVESRCFPNLAVSEVLGKVDIDGDGQPDNAPDSDGDGLPDNWELGGVEALTSSGEKVDRVVFIPAPTAIVPGTPPTPIFTRLAVATNAFDPDTDDDGLTDFIEVFGLMFIDDDIRVATNDNSGIINTRDGRLTDTLDWQDKNKDGLPSPGEFPLDSNQTGTGLLHDFDGFVFTDPTNRDTDGDSIDDGTDKDPLINPRAFGNVGQFIVRFNATGNDDIDVDGLGNGMDMGNDLTSADGEGILDFQVIDNPENLSELLELFRPDLLAESAVPEAAIEDLLGADWDGNGLWRTTDVRTWSIVIDDPTLPLTTVPPAAQFEVRSKKLYATQTLEQLLGTFNQTNCNQSFCGRPVSGEPEAGSELPENSEGLGLGWQDLLKPSGRTPFLPDREGHVWAIVYSWRMPGFDIDGDGFVGVPNVSSTATHRVDADGNELRVKLERNDEETGLQLAESFELAATDQPFDDRIPIETRTFGEAEAGTPVLDGRIEAPGLLDGASAMCGAMGMVNLLGIGAFIPFLRWRFRN